MTSIVAYEANGNLSNNDIIDNGAKDGSANGPAGFAFVDANGQPINTCGCPTTTTTTTSTIPGDHFQCYEIKPKTFVPYLPSAAIECKLAARE